MDKSADLYPIELMPPHVGDFLRSGYEDFESFWEKAMRRVMKSLWLEVELGDLSTIEEEPPWRKSGTR